MWTGPAGYPKVPLSSVPSYGQPTGPVLPPDLRQPPTREPEWMRGGSYMVVRASVQKTRDWDRVPLGGVLGSQEHAVGRFKDSGASLDRQDDPDQRDLEPLLASDQSRLEVAVTAHIRKSNPRGGPGDASRRVFRRNHILEQLRDAWHALNDWNDHRNEPEHAVNLVDPLHGRMVESTQTLAAEMHRNLSVRPSSQGATLPRRQ